MSTGATTAIASKTRLGGQRYDDDETADVRDALDAAAADWVDWGDFFANATGPGARVARAANAARKSAGLSTADVLGILLDLAADAGAALAGPEPLVVNASFDLLAERDSVFVEEATPAPVAMDWTRCLAGRDAIVFDVTSTCLGYDCLPSF